MTKRLVILLVLLITLGVASSVYAGSSYCWYECNEGGSDTCVYTGDCYRKCYNLTGGCISGMSAECFDRCAF